MKTILAVNNLSKYFYPSLFSVQNPYKAVDNISFELAEGEVLGFLGANGSGKTTTIQMLLSVMTPTAGTISFFGKDLARHRSEILQDVGYATTYAKLPSRLTISENIVFYGRLYGLSGHECDVRMQQLLSYFGLWDRRHQQTESLSAGQMTRVNLVRAFLHKPKIVLLDEPTAALDPDIGRDVRSLILELQHTARVSLLFTSHNMTEVAQICDRVLVLDKGHIIANDTPESLAATLSRSKLELTFGDGFKRTVAYAEKCRYAYTLMGRSIIIELDEKDIASFLQGLATQNVQYLTVAITKPTLEDYFLHITKR